MSIYFETKRLIARPWQESDIDELLALCSDPKVMEFFPALLDRKGAVSMLASLMRKQEEQGHCAAPIACKETGAFLGFCGLTKVSIDTAFTPAVEMAWRLHVRHWGQGFVSEAAVAWLEYGFKVMKMSEVFAFSVPQNLRSIAVMNRIGMKAKPQFDFDHPNLPATSPLLRHLVYRASKEE